MAIYSLNLGFISRSEGRSSVGFSAYIGASSQVDTRTGTSYNYLNKELVLVSRVLAPVGSPDWVNNPDTLWNRIEHFEDEVASLRFRCDWEDPEKQRKSIEAKKRFLDSAQTAQTVMGALPIELSQEQAEACVEEFLQERFVTRNLVVHYAIHWDKGNPHFHALVTRRPLIGDTFSLKKDRDIVSKLEHNATRKAWENVANKHLALAGVDARIDCRSNKERGSLFLSSLHEGYYAQSLAEKGFYSHLVADNEKIRQRNIEILCEHPEALVFEVSSKRTTFTARHLTEEIIRRVGGDEHLLAILKARLDNIDIAKETPHEKFKTDFATEVKNVADNLTNSLLSKKEIVSYVGKNIHKEDAYTSTAYKNQEEHIITLADTLFECSLKSLDPTQIEAAVKKGEQEAGFSFSEEQRAAIYHLCTGQDIRLLNGRAGTGKTTLLKAVAAGYKQAGYRVLGTGFQGKAVETLEQQVGIPCKTLDSFKVAWERYEQQKSLLESNKLWGKSYSYALQKLKDLESHRLTSKDVILVDEANTIGGRLWEIFLKEAVSNKAKVLIIQDTAQIKSREPGDYGRLFAGRYGSCETLTVVRQKKDWQKACSTSLNKGDILEGLLPYHQKGHLQWKENAYDTHAALVQEYINSLKENPKQSHVALTYRNLDVEALNQTIRNKLKEQGALKFSFKVKGSEYAIGDRIRFTENDHQGWHVKNTSGNLLQLLKERFIPDTHKGVKNGTFGTIASYNKWTSTIHARLEDGRLVKFDPSVYAHITHGYALGIHKSEGSTFDRTFVCIDPLLDPATLLVAMTRHREDVKAYINREHIIDFKALLEKVGQSAFRETLQDYQVPKNQRPYLKHVQQYKDLTLDRMTLREKMEGDLAPGIPLYKHPSYPTYKELLQKKKEVACLILKQWDNHLPYVRLAGIRRDVLEVDANVRPRILSDLEHSASIQVQGYIDLTIKTRALWKTLQETHPGPIAKNHPLYGEYKALKIERDSLAHVFQENPRLYSPFLKIQKEERTGKLKDFWGEELSPKDRIYWTTIKAHAKAHMHSQMQKAYEERLTSEQKALYTTLQTYREACKETAIQFQQIKQDGNVDKIFDGLKEARIKRDALATRIVHEIEKYEPFIEKLKVSEEKLLEHATFGQIRKHIHAYQREQDYLKRASYAQDLKTLIGSTNNPKIQMLLKQEGFDAKRIAFDILFAQKINAGEISKEISSEYTFNHIRDYLNTSQEVAKAWRTNSLNRTEALQVRKESSARLLDHETALLLFKELYPNQAQKLQSHAGQLLPHKPYIEADLALTHMRGHYEEIAKDLLGEPNRFLSSKSFLRFGTNGKVVVNISGHKEGLWYDFSEGKGGNIFQLIQQEKGVDFKEAVKYCASFVNLPEERSSFRQHIPQQQTQDISGDTKERLKSVLELQNKSLPIEGTPAEIYLRKERRIEGILGQDLRYIPKETTFTYKGEKKTLNHDCFAAFGRNRHESLRNVQLTKLDQHGKRAVSPLGEKLNKIQYGLSKGGFVTIQEDLNKKNANRVFIAEGVETALSLKEAGLPGKIVASLGIHNIKNYKGPAKEIILCADNDGPHAVTPLVLQHTKEHFKNLGKAVTIIAPEKEGQDFNDVLKKEGIRGVQTYFSAYIVQPMKQHKELFLQNSQSSRESHTQNPAIAKEAHRPTQRQNNKDFER